MKLNRFLSAVLSAALLTGLCACGPHDPVGDDPSAGVSASARPSPTPEAPETSEPSEDPPEDSASPEPTSSPAAEYDKEHRLDGPVPELIDGLEMPVVGATGYTSVELPLWSSIPGTPAQPKPSPSQPEPTPSEPPAVSESPEPPPVETEEPAPGDPTESAPAQAPEDPEPTPEQMPEPPSEPGQPEPMGYTAGPAHTAAPASAPKPARALGSYAGAVTVWEPGTAFVILEERGDWWRVSRGSETGWIEHRYCMINLPDVIPSIIYDDANAYSSRYVSSGKEIPGVTGEILYHSLVYNVRLGRQEYVMPMLYSAARNVCAAQHRALAEGNCLVVCQTFQPYDTQTAVASALTQLATVDPEVQAGLSTPPWSMDWFTASGSSSNHQCGYALDVSMVKVYGTETRYIGSCPYLYMTDYAQYEMPTAMHELSLAAVSAASPNSSQLSETMNGPAIALREYFVASGLTPLASEWWHFSDNAAMRASSANPSDGKYDITECLSRLPELAAGSAL